MRAQPIRVYIADDHSIFRHGVRQLLASNDDIAIVGEAVDGASVLNAALDQCDVLLLDLSLPRYNGLEVLRRLRGRFPLLRVIVLSMYPAEQYEARCLAEGAAVYVHKSLPAEELPATIRRVAAGSALANVEVASMVRRPVTPAALHDGLTAREYQVFSLIVVGKKVSEIAAEIDVQPSTVSNHLARIKEKLGAESIAEIVHYAHRAGLID